MTAERHQYRFISSVAVDDLFGYEEIRLDFGLSAPGLDRQINILYGENGEGKSTVLRLVYSILSSQDHKGLKNWVFKAPFTRAKIDFSDGTSIEVSKNLEKKRGLYVRVRAETERMFRMFANDNGVISAEVRGTQVMEFLKFIDEFSPRLFYITDTRQYFTNSEIIDYSLDSESSRQSIRVSIDGKIQTVDSPKSNDSLDVVSMSRIITNVFRSEIYQSGVLGEQDSNEVYQHLVGGIATSGSGTPKYSRDAILDEIRGVQELTARAASIGVITGFNASYFDDAVRNASRSNINKIALVVVPYLDSIKARVRAASEYVDRMTSFLSELNHFYRDKQFSFNMSDGFSVRSKRGSGPIDLNWLSSGERQLFIILSSVFLTQSSAAIVLIDEPELSLNILWQREFVASLQRISQFSPVQYILASHSLEILSSKAGVVRQLTAQRQR